MRCSTAAVLGAIVGDADGSGALSAPSYATSPVIMVSPTSPPQCRRCFGLWPPPSLCWLPRDVALPAESERPRRSPGVAGRLRAFDEPDARRKACARSLGSMLGASLSEFKQKWHTLCGQPSSRR